MIFCFILHVRIAQGQGRQPLGTIFFMEAERPYHFDHWLHVWKNVFALWFYAHFFMILYMYIALEGADNHWGQNFDFNRKAYSLWSFLQVLKKFLQLLILYTFFHDLVNAYSCGLGADNPQGTNFLCQQKRLVTSVICCKFQKNIFQVWFYTHFFMILYMCTALGQGQKTPWSQQKSLITFTHFL